ncbi:MAG: amino acid ABC transporter permease [Anaerolineales bacterium]
MTLDTLTNMVTYIVGGVWVTIGVTLIALPMGFALGLLLALARIYGGKLMARLATIYGAAMRGVPPIVMLFVLFFVIAGAIDLSPFLAGSLSLGIISSAYQAEIFRGAITSVGGGQMMAARSVGMSQRRAIRFIVLPQALRLAIPSWSNEAATVVKDSSLVYALGVAEVLRRAQFQAARTYQPLIAFSIAAVIYFVLTFITNRVLDYIERRTAIPVY